MVARRRQPLQILSMRTANPALSAKTFSGLSVQSGEERMTLQGTVNKTMLLLGLLLLPAAYVWQMHFTDTRPELVPVVMIGGLVGGLVLALVTIFKKVWAPYTAPLYAVAEGCFLGGLSAFMEARFPGIVVQAVGLTFGTAAALLFAYSSRLIKPSENFKLGVAAATGGIAIVYLVTIGLSFFKIQVPFIHGSGLIGIGFSAFVVVIAALNLVLDFDFIEQATESGAPKYMEWYAAFGLLVTLVWLYLEILRLLSKLRGR